MNLRAVREGNQVVWLDFQDWFPRVFSFGNLLFSLPENRKSQKYNKPPAREAPFHIDLQNSRTTSSILHVSATKSSSCFQSQKDQVFERWAKHGCRQHTYIYICVCIYIYIFVSIHTRLGGISSNTTVPAVILFSLVVPKTNTHNFN